MTEERFTVTYDGPALDAHVMDARDFASSVLALSDVFREAQDIIDPTAPKARLAIEANQPGSFEVILQLISDGWTATRDWLLNDGQAALNLGSLVTGVVGAFAGIKALKGRKVEKAAPDQNDAGMVQLTLTDGTKLTVPADQSKLISDLAFRRAAAEVVRPLEADGVDSITTDHDGAGVRIEKEDAQSFAPPTQDEGRELETRTRETNLQIVGVDFGETRKWRFTEGDGQNVVAAMNDSAFRDRIESQEEKFGKFDILKVQLRTKQSLSKDGRLRLEHEITRVLDHLPAGRQTAFDLDALSNDSPAGEVSPED